MKLGRKLADIRGRDPMWLGDRRGRRRVRASERERLIVGAEAFLSGTYEDHARACGRRVPGWARMNRFAHGDLHSVRQTTRPFDAANSADVADWPEQAWQSAQKILGGEVLELVSDDPQRLLQIQRVVLVPLELELMRAGVGSRLTALELVQLTRLALRSSAP